MLKVVDLWNACMRPHAISITSQNNPTKNPLICSAGALHLNISEFEPCAQARCLTQPFPCCPVCIQVTSSHKWLMNGFIIIMILALFHLRISQSRWLHLPESLPLPSPFGRWWRVGEGFVLYTCLAWLIGACGRIQSNLNSLLPWRLPPCPCDRP